MTKEQIENYGNQPATSCVGYSTMGDSYHQLGLTIREYFASKAMQGYAGGEFTGQAGMPVDQIAEWSVQMADALIEALGKKEKDLKE